MTRLRWRDTEAAGADRVTAVEVFFDVVFVFTLTQLTRTLEEDLSLAGVGRTLLVFGALWYMCVHLILFTQADALEGVLRLAPYILGGAVLILLAAYFGGAAMYGLWVAGYLLRC
jgi:low temperature requirement protein LtrA